MSIFPQRYTSALSTTSQPNQPFCLPLAVLRRPRSFSLFKSDQSSMLPLYLASFVAVTSAVNIVAFCSANCNPGGFNGIVRTCVNIPSNICCGFPLSHISSVYVGTFPLPGGIGTWNRESGRIPACGQVMDSGGASDSVCLSTVLNGLLPSYDNGGGGMWFPVPRIDPTKTRSGSVVPKIATPVGFNNIAGFARSGFKRRSFSLVDRQMERRDSEDAMSIEELQVSGL